MQCSTPSTLAAALVAILHVCAVQARYQGDIMLTPEQQRSLEATSNPNSPFSPQNAVVRNMRSLWPNAVVPFIIDNSLGKSPSNLFEHAELVIRWLMFHYIIEPLIWITILFALHTSYHFK